MPKIPDKILRSASGYIEMFTGIKFSPVEIQALCDEGGISQQIIDAGEVATGEREMFQDVIAKKLAKRTHWALNMDGEDRNFPKDLVSGLAEWRADRMRNSGRFTMSKAIPVYASRDSIAAIAWVTVDSDGSFELRVIDGHLRLRALAELNGKLTIEFDAKGECAFLTFDNAT